MILGWILKSNTNNKIQILGQSEKFKLQFNLVLMFYLLVLIIVLSLYKKMSLFKVSTHQ